MPSDLEASRAYLLASLPWTEKQLSLSHPCVEQLRILAEHATAISVCYDQPEEGAVGALLLCGQLVVEGEPIIFSCEFRGGPIFDDEEQVSRVIYALAEKHGK